MAAPSDPFVPDLSTSGPVVRVAAADGRPAWVVSGHEAVSMVLADPRFGVEPPGGGHPDNTTLFRDGPPHDRLRGLVSRAFTPRRVAALAPLADATAERAVLAMTATGPPADLVEHLAAPLSATVIAEMLGIADDQRAGFRRLADGALMADPADESAVIAGWQAFMAYAEQVVDARRTGPGDDLLSGLIAVQDDDGDRLSGPELVGMVIALVGAGYVSGRNAIAVGAVHLMGRLHDVDDEAIEEALRMTGGLTGELMPRWALQDLELGGVAIAAGDQIVVSAASANRDPHVFPDPDEFARRRPNPHLTFGRGPHHCLGAAVARLELRAAFTALARHVPGLRLAVAREEIPWVRGHVDSGPAALPVTWLPAT